MVATVLFGGFLRIYRLHTVPPGLFFDEAANLFDIQSVLQGARPLYFPANNGREPIFFYWASLFASYWGLTPYAIRLASAAVGVLTLPATYFCAREACRAWSTDRRWAEWTSVAATYILSVTYLHLHYSRIGLRTILLPFFLALSFGFLLRGLRRGSLLAFGLSGVLGGLSIYTYIASRVAPALLVIPPLALRPNGRFRWAIERVFLVAIIWALVCVPLGVYYLRHAADLVGHTDDVSILNPVNNHGDPVGAVAHGVVATIGAFDFVGTNAAEQNLPYRPILDPIQSVFLALGLGTLVIGAIRASRQTTVPRGSDQSFSEGRPGSSLRPLVATFLIAWILDQAIPSALAVNPPGFIRMTGTLPALSIVGGFGVSTAYRWLATRTTAPRVATMGIALALAFSAVWTARDYFLEWAPSPQAYHLMMADKVDASTYLNLAAASNRVFLAPLYARDNTIRFLTRNVSIETFDIQTGLVVPTDRARDVQYIFPADDANEAAFVAGELPVAFTNSTVADPANSSPLLIRLAVPAAALPERPAAVATFGDAIGLVRTTVDQPRVTPGATIVVTLEWLALMPPAEDYTVFLHVRDVSDATAAQADGPPAAGTLPTTQWRAGDLIWDRHALALPPSIKPGHYRIVAGLYRLAELQRLPARIQNGPARADEVEVGSVDVSVP